MTSQCGRWRAASSAPAAIIAAVSEKLPDETAPTPASRAAASIASKSSAVSPEVPITTATPAPIAVSACSRATSCDVKSISTSTPSSASPTLAKTGAPETSDAGARARHARAQLEVVRGGDALRDRGPGPAGDPGDADAVTTTA